MNSTRLKHIENRDSDDSGALVSQLEREISCLQRQLDRLRLLDGNLDKRIQDTYADMISNRKDMLSELCF